MTTTLIGEPGDMDSEAEAAGVIHDFEELLRMDAERVKVLDVGRSVINIVDRGVQRGIGRVVNTGFVMPKRDMPVEISPGVYYLN